MSYRIVANSQIGKFLAKQEKSVQLRVMSAVDKLPTAGDIGKMQGMKNTYRLRVGTIRILFTVDHTEKVVYLQTIDNRGDIY